MKVYVPPYAPIVVLIFLGTALVLCLCVAVAEVTEPGACEPGSGFRLLLTSADKVDALLWNHESSFLQPEAR